MMNASNTSSDVMVTGRMTAEKKAAGNRVLESLGLTSSQAINMLYERLIADEDAAFLGYERPRATEVQVLDALEFIRGMSLPPTSMFDGMTKGEIKLMRFQMKEAGGEVKP